MLKTVKYVEHESMANAREIVETGEVMIFVGAVFVVTGRHGEHGGLASVRKRLDASPTTLKVGRSAVMHAIADHVVDSYLDVTDLVEVDVDAMEEAHGLIAADRARRRRRLATPAASRRVP